MTQSPTAHITRTASNPWTEAESRNMSYRFQDLSGTHLGARIEEIEPGSSSSHHHYHSSEEEHVYVLQGAATLIWGNQRIPLSPGDHLRFYAGESVAHHIQNDSDAPCSYLVYGERKADDVVVYPEHQVMLIKSLGNQQITYRPIHLDEASDKESDKESEEKSDEA